MSLPDSTLLQSLPGLATALRHVHQIPPTAIDAFLQLRRVVPMYRIQATNADREARQTAELVEGIINRLQRLGSAYGEWSEFDAGAYFDLQPVHLAHLVRISERVNTVHVIFYVDSLLPAFHEMVRYYSDEFSRTYQGAHGHAAADDDGSAFQRFYEISQPGLLKRWERMLQIMHAARRLLAESPTYLMANGAREEQLRWRANWLAEAVRGLAPGLTPALRQVPTLTLSYDFPLPAHRQPGRIRRLRANRERRNYRRQSRDGKDH